MVSLFSLPLSLLLSAPVRYVVYMYMYVLINSGFVTVWSIENESRDYELQGKDFAKKLLSPINMYHAFFSTFCQLTTQSMLFSSAQVWTSQCTILMSFNDMYNL